MLNVALLYGANGIQLVAVRGFFIVYTTYCQSSFRLGIIFLYYITVRSGKREFSWVLFIPSVLYHTPSSQWIKKWGLCQFLSCAVSMSQLKKHNISQSKKGEWVSWVSFSREPVCFSHQSSNKFIMTSSLSYLRNPIQLFNEKTVAALIWFRIKTS